MIKVFLRGGLGNQMFQYAAGLQLAKKNNTELLLDAVFLSDRFPRRQFTYRTYDLDIFEIQPKFTLLSEISAQLPISGVWLGLDIVAMNIRKALGLQSIIKENDEYRFDPKVIFAKGNVLLWGRWQSEKYFSDVVQEVRAAFRFKEKLSAEAKQLANQIQKINSVSLHVRRGDYVKFDNMKKIMGDTNMSYYEEAVKYIADHVRNPHFFIFSDDISWCKENLKLAFPVTYVENATAGYKSGQHLQLMSLCKNNIITNSTFSWWGAWLNHDPNKIVVAQKYWIANNPTTSADIIPDGWIKL